ncbi:hypothetical protein predicted by Glimmer/Critica [Limosilactobacillus fermentum]|nr:hypothetical protein predicted by Glimmer/Critica [Limosilactobacillus fermentum]
MQQKAGEYGVFSGLIYPSAGLPPLKSGRRWLIYKKD